MAVPNKQMKRRMLGVIIIFTALFLLVVARLFWVQVLNNSLYSRMASKQAFSNQVTSPNRGVIYDRNGNTLAMDVPTSTIIADPSMIKKMKLDTKQVAQIISSILKLDCEEIEKKLELKRSYVVLKKKVDDDTAESLRKSIVQKKISGISIEPDVNRVYPNGNLAAQVIGFAGIDNQGLSGIEMELEQYLKGLPGKKSYVTDLLGRKIPTDKGEGVEAQDGLNITLTIDHTIQYIAETALQKAIEKYKVLNGACAIVVDPRNGEVLAMVSKPDFDLNDPYAMPKGVTGLDKPTWDRLNSDDKIKKLQETVWRNKAINATYEPGSTFKVVSAAAGLDEGVIAPDSPVVDEPISVSGWTIKCQHIPSHGKETFKEGLYRSCNPVFVKLSQALGIKTFYKYINAFGFDKTTGMDLPGEAGSIIQKDPKTIDMSVASFGQGLQITPIQLIMAYSAIANGGKLLKPQIIKKMSDSQGNIIQSYYPELIRNVISKQTSNTLKDMLRGAVIKGTGVNAYISGFDVAGKTGTAQTFVNGKRDDDRYIASFAAFAPTENPLICVLVVCDYPSISSHLGGTVAAPVVKEIIEESLDYLNIERRYTEEELKKLSQSSNPQEPNDSNTWD